MTILSFDERFGSIEARLAIIEEKLQISLPVEVAQQRVVESRKSQVTERESVEVKSEFKSGNMLGIIAIICFVLAAGFIIKLSIDSGWLTPVRQMGIAALFGFVLIGSGLKLLNVDREYASYLPATGIIVLYITMFASYRLYSLFSFYDSIAVSAAISLLCISLYIKIRNDIYPMTAAVGAYLTPMILGLTPDTSFTLYYFLVCSATFAIFSIFVKSRILTMLSAYLAILVTASVGFDLNQNVLISSMLALQFLIFTIGTFLHSQYVGSPMTESESWAFFPVLLIFYVAEYHFLGLIKPDLAAWISLGFAAFLVSLYLAAKTLFGKEKSISQSMIFTFVTIVVFHAGYLELLPIAAGPWLFALMVSGFALLPDRYYQTKHDGWMYITIFGLVGVVLINEYYLMACHLFANHLDEIAWLPDLFAMASIWLFAVSKSKVNDFGYFILGAAHFLVILALYRLADPSGSLAVSASWLVYAVGIIVFAYYRKDKVMANSALLVLGLAAGKALIVDAASSPTIVRILCLLLTGVVLYAAGLLFRRIARW